MRKLVVAVCLMTICSFCAAATSTDRKPYTFKCTSDKQATVTVDQGFTLKVVQGRSSCTVTGSSPYSLKEDCLKSTVTLSVEKGTPGVTFITDKDLHQFKLSCKDDDGALYSVTPGNNLHIDQPNPTLVEGTAHPADRIELFLVNATEPSSKETSSQLKTRAVRHANLGDTLCLTILDTHEPDTKIIPRSCTVMGMTSPQPLWQLDPPTCIKANDVVVQQFKQPQKTTDNKKFSFMKIKAFKLVGQQTADITFSCEVRVCITDTNECSTDGSKLAQCSSSTNVKQRGRREVNHAASSNKIHHLTTTLRVINNVMSLGTAGSTTVTYTLPCLLLSLVVRVIM